MTSLPSALAGRRRFAGAAAIVLPVFAIVLGTRMWEPKEIGRYDPAYWLAIPQVAKSVPLFEVCAAPRYSLVRQDGLRPQLSVVRYGATASPDELIDRYRTAFEASKCAVADKDGMLLAETCAPPFDHAELSVEITRGEAGSDCTAVAISLVGG